MSFDGIMVAALRNELAGRLPGARIDKIFQPEANLVTLTIRNQGRNSKLLVSFNPGQALIHLTEHDFENPLKPPDFCMLLRKYLLRGVITGVRQPDFERMLEIQIELRGRTFYLMAELIGNYSNLVLVDEGGMVLDAGRRVTAEISRFRQLYPGIKYKYPPRQDKLNPLQLDQEDFFEAVPGDFKRKSFRVIMDFIRGIGPEMAREIVYRAEIDPDKPYDQLTLQEQKAVYHSFRKLFMEIAEGSFSPTIGLDASGEILYYNAFPLEHRPADRLINFEEPGELFAYYYSRKISRNRLTQERNSLQSVVQSFLKKNQRQQEGYEDELAAARNADQYKRKGELITANLYQLEKGETEIEVTDYYDPEYKKTTIELDPRYSPAENAQRYFKKYNKARKSVKHLKRQLGRLRHEERYLNQVDHDLEQAETRKDLAEIADELKEEGYLKTRKKGRKKRPTGKEKPLPPYRFKSSDGYDILVGRNSRQNDTLTKKLANKGDLWLHIKQLAGSHVIVRNHTGEEIPEETLREAAVLAASFSKGKQSVNVPIDYTEVRNVKKPKGSRPGLVYYENYHTIYVTPDPGLVKKLRR